MKGILLSICLLFTILDLSAQNYSTITGKVSDDGLKEVKLFKVVDGEKVLCASTQVSPDGDFGFTLVPGQAGFYAVGGDYYNFDLYLKGGDRIRLDILDTKARLMESNTRENKALYRWLDYSAGIRLKSMFFMKTESNYEDFFPDFKKFLAGIPALKKELKSGNKEFDAILEDMVGYDTDLMALAFLYTPRSKHAPKELLPDYYRQISSLQKFADDRVLSFTRGEQMLSFYMLYVAGSRKDNETEKQYVDRCLRLLGGERVRQVYLLKHVFSRYKTYDRYLEGIKEYGPLFTSPAVKARIEAIGTGLYKSKLGGKAADFTYPDVNGKMVSLSDFKGKVVLVDVWATWCGPCKKEIPHLIRLEKEMHGTDLVVLGVSVNEKKDKQKWLDFIKKEGLGGIQVFASGWSKITKDYKIQGIPRFMVFDKKGNIVTTDAPRPSDPTLKQLLLRELKK